MTWSNPRSPLNVPGGVVSFRYFGKIIPGKTPSPTVATVPHVARPPLRADDQDPEKMDFLILRVNRNDISVRTERGYLIVRTGKALDVGVQCHLAGNQPERGLVARPGQRNSGALLDALRRQCRYTLLRRARFFPSITASPALPIASTWLIELFAISLSPVSAAIKIELNRHNPNPIHPVTDRYHGCRCHGRI